MTVRPALAALFLVLATGCVNAGDDNTAAPQPAPGRSEAEGGANGAQGDGETQAGEPAPSEDGNTTTARPSAELEGSCKQKPREGEEGQELIARLRVTNTGNLGVVVRVAAQWPLAPDEGVSRWARVRVEQGDTMPVTLRLPVTESVAQEALAAADSGRKCWTRSRVTGAFGMPSDS